jgi:hypothetical protein
MSDTYPFHLPWLDLWQYSTELPLVMAGPFAPLMACSLPPTEWGALLSTYAMLPAAVAGTLTKTEDPA